MVCFCLRGRGTKEDVYVCMCTGIQEDVYMCVCTGIQRMVNMFTKMLRELLSPDGEESGDILASFFVLLYGI